MILDIATIRSRIELALDNELGTYNFELSNGGTASLPALQIDHGSFKIINGQVWAQQPSVTGLECVIQPEIASPGYAARLGGDFVCSQQSRITIKQWDLSDTTLTARSLMLQEFANLFDSPPVRILRNTMLDSIEQLIFTFTLASTS